mgnify:CR=1 FL=1
MERPAPAGAAFRSGASGAGSAIGNLQFDTKLFEEGEVVILDPFLRQAAFAIISEQVQQLAPHWPAIRL